MFTPDNLNVFQLPSLAPWSVDFYWHTPQSADPEFTCLEKLKAISESATSKKLREKSGEPVGICIHDSILEREKAIREKMREKQKEMQ